MTKKRIRGGPERGNRKRTSLHPLDMEEALKGFLEVDPEKVKEEEKGEKRRGRSTQTKEKPDDKPEGRKASGS